jgi:hypothetical protein
LVEGRADRQFVIGGPADLHQACMVQPSTPMAA